MTQTHRATPLWRKILKVTAWTVMAVVLAIAATAICLVKVVEPEELTPLVEATANKMLDARVSIGRVELAFHGKAPFVRLRIDSLTIISEPMRRLRSGGRHDMPTWADTLLTLKSFEGSINLPALLASRIDLHDVVFERPRVNLFTVDEQHSNYLIFTPDSTDTDTTETHMSMPSFSIDHFSIKEPYPLRFSNLSTGEHFTVALQSLSIDSNGNPVYDVTTSGDVAASALSLYNLSKVGFGLNGGVGWDSSRPSELEVRNFKLLADFIDATVNAHVDFGQDIIVSDFDIALGEMGIERILSVIPDSIRARYDIGPEKFSTDMKLSFAARSTAPFNITTDSLPSADVVINLTPGAVTLGKITFDRVGGTVKASLAGNDIDASTFSLHDFLISGPATKLVINAEATRVMTDPRMSGCIKGSTDLRRLPSQLLDRVGGWLSGRVELDVDFRCDMSMLDADNFHRINVDGDVDFKKLYYLAADTNLMIYANDACLRFGTDGRTNRADSLLTAVIKADSTEIVTGDAAMTITDFSLGVGVSNKRRSSDSTVVVPMGGGLRFKTFDVSLLGHETTIKFRDVDGRVSMRRYRRMARVPQFDFNLGIGRMSFGSNTSRFMLSGSEVSLSAHKIGRRPRNHKVASTVDSMRRVYPHMSVDSVYAYALRKHRPSPNHRPRVHPQYTDSASEIIYWGTADGFKRLLLDWDISGKVTSERAGLYTTSFPIRNRVRNFNATFNTDSVVLTNVQYKAGSSDFLISGCMSNMRRAFTSRGFAQPLRINFDVLSDTIDVNQLAGTFFRGAAAREAEARNHTSHHLNLDALEAAEERADSLLEHEIGRAVAGAPDSVAPLLIPTNIDMKFNMKADNVRYADILFNDFHGELLAYGGALNLHSLSARSDVGSVNMSALYAAPQADDLRFGFGLEVSRFNIARFLQMLPAVDSVMPMLRDMSGIINADVAATCDLNSDMTFVLPTLSAAIRLEGDSLELIDEETYRTIGKWLLFKDKQRNIIDHVNVEMTVQDNMLRMYPFIFNIDRYKLGVQGYNDLAMNFKYHIAVLKSPLPFKFGINISGNPDKYKIRLGKARFNEKTPTSVAIVDTTRINLLKEIENVFRRGVSRSRFGRLKMSSVPTAAEIDLDSDTISAADSAVFIREGLIPAVAPQDGDQPDNTPAPRPSTNVKPNSEATLKQ